MARIAVLGSINVDRVAPVDRETMAALADRYDWFPDAGETRPVEGERVPEAVDEHVAELSPGGKGANGAVAAARAGADVTMYGAVGPDADDVGALAELRAAGVDTSPVAHVDEPTGTAYVFVAPDGENHIVTVRGANDSLDRAYVHEHVDAIRAADCLLVPNEAAPGALEALFTALAGQHDRPTVVLDPAPVGGAGDLIDHPCPDVVAPNEHEAAALGDALARTDATVVRTRGPDPVAVEAEDGSFEVAPPAVEAVDTTGAGDVFDGYLAAGIAAGGPLQAAVERACTAAALSVERRGVQPVVPDRERVEANGGRGADG